MVNLVWSPWIFVSIATTAGLATLGLYVWRHRATQGGVSFLVLLAAVALWVLLSGLEHIVPDLETKFLFARLSWLAVPLVPAAAFVVALQARGLDRWTRPRHLAALAVVPVTMNLLIWTNDHHHLVWKSVGIDHSGPWSDLLLPHGPAFWASVVYHYALLVTATWLLAGKYWREWAHRREEALLVGMAVAAPWAANAVYLVHEAGTPSLDLTPYAFSVTAACLSLALWRGHSLLTVIRVARSQILDQMSDGALVVDVRGRLVYANQAAREALSLPPLLGPVAVERVLGGHPELVGLLRGERDEPEEISIHHPERGCCTFHLSTTTLSDFQGITTSRSLVLREVTAYKRTESALRESEDLLRKVIDAVPHMIFAKGRDGRYLLVNRTLAEQRGMTSEELVGLPPDASVTPERVRRMQDEDRGVIETGRPCFHPEIAWQLPSGEERTYQVTKLPFTDPRSGEPAMLGIAIDVTDRKASEERMRALAYHDGLTGLPNRERFRRLLDQALEVADRRRRRSALLFLDLDRFKEVNDRLGHARGDELLQAVAGRLREIVRWSDRVMGPDVEEGRSTVSRLGGDEFTVLLAEIERPLDAALVAQRILEALAEPFQVGSHELRTSASVGIAIFPNDAEDADGLFRHADQAMYDAKRRGRNVYTFFSPSLNEASARRQVLEAGLQGVLDRDELTLRYQPARHAESGDLSGAEVLLRWHHPELGEVSPEEFVPVAEDMGQIVPMGEWVLRSVCEQLRHWRERGLATPRVAVNVSGFQVRHSSLVDVVDRILAETETSPDQLELEVTESTVMTEDAQTRATLHQLKDRGVGFALDDFGTGYSSLSYLRRFPFDTIKIDRSFVEHLATDPDDQALVRAIVDMAHGFELCVVAEGVETLAQLEILRAAGCDVIQGHLISRPLLPEDFVRFLEREKAR